MILMLVSHGQLLKYYLLSIDVMFKYFITPAILSGAFEFVCFKMGTALQACLYITMIFVHVGHGQLLKYQLLKIDDMFMFIYFITFDIF